MVGDMLSNGEEIQVPVMPDIELAQLAQDRARKSFIPTHIHISFRVTCSLKEMNSDLNKREKITRNDACNINRSLLQHSKLDARGDIASAYGRVELISHTIKIVESSESFSSIDDIKMTLLDVHLQIHLPDETARIRAALEFGIGYVSHISDAPVVDIVRQILPAMCTPNVEFTIIRDNWWCCQFHQYEVNFHGPPPKIYYTICDEMH